jgi:transposase-like protein
VDKPSRSTLKEHQRQRHTPELIIRKPRIAEQMLSEGRSIDEAAKALEVSEQTLHRRRNQYGGMKAAGAKRLKSPRGERAAEAPGRRQGAGDLALKEAADRQGKLLSPSRRRRAVRVLMNRVGLSERRACRIARQNRSTQRQRPRVAPDDASLRARPRRTSGQRPRRHCRHAHGDPVTEGWPILGRDRAPKGPKDRETASI